MSSLRKSIAGLLLCLGLCRAGLGGEPALDGPLREMRERAQRCYDAGDYDGGHRAMAELVAAMPGRTELAAEMLGVMWRASMADRRMNSWTEYASERLVAMHRAGLLEKDNATLSGAYDCLCVMRWEQGRLSEAWEAMQRLLELEAGNPYAHIGAARMLHQVGSPEALTMIQDVLDSVDGGIKTWKTRELLMVIDRSLDASWPWDRIPILDPWRSSFSRGSTRRASVESFFGSLKAAVAQRRIMAAMGQQARRVEKGKRKNAPVVAAPAASEVAGQEGFNPAVQSPDKDPALFDRYIRLSAGRDQPVPDGDGAGLLDYWRLIDLRLQPLDAAAVNPLRQLQENRYKELTAQAPAGQRSARDQLAWYRTSPWSPAANLDLLASAQAELNLGHTAAAARSFRDVLAHSPDPTARQAAQVGLWLAAASEDNAAGLELLFGGVDPKANFPWLGRTASAADIKARLLKGMTAVDRENTPLAGLEPRVLRLPAAPVWPGDTLSIRHGASLVDLQVRGNRLLAGARNWQAWYDTAATATPLWTAMTPVLMKDQPGEVNLPGRWHPATGRGRIYTRAGTNSMPSVVRAVDVESGLTAWETAVAPGEFHAIGSDPVVAGSCVYYMELAGQKANDGYNSRLDVVCVAADDGMPVWRATVCDSAADTPAGLLLRNLPLTARVRGNGLAVSDGAVYCSGPGIAARFDARDGRAEWVRTCRVGIIMPKLIRSGLAEPLGGAPLIAGDRAVFVAQDGAGLYSVDLQTGRLLWDQEFVQPLEMAGATKETAVVRTMTGLAGVELGTGAVRWNVPLAQDVVGRCTLRGNVVTVGLGDALLSVNAEDGSVLERRAWPDGRTAWNYVVAGKSLLMVTDETAPTAAYRPDTALGTAGETANLQLRLPLKRSWSLPCDQRARVFAPPAGSPLQGRIYLACDGMLEAVDVGNGGRSAWRRFTMGTVNRILFDKNAIVLCSGGEARPSAPNEAAAMTAMVMDGQTGQLLWRLPEFGGADGAVLADGVLVVHDGETEMRAYDVVTGRLLWDRKAMCNLSARGWPVEPCVQAGQMHLFASRLHIAWPNGVADSRVDLKTGKMLPVQWLAKGDIISVVGRSGACVGTGEALVCVVGKNRDAGGHVYRYTLANGAVSEVPGVSRMWSLGSPYVMAGNEDDHMRKLLRCDDAGYAYPLDSRQPFAFTDGILVQVEGKGWAVTDTARKQRLAMMDVVVAKNGIQPGIVRLDDTRLLFHASGENEVALKELERQSGKVIAEAVLPGLDHGRDIMAVSGGSVLLVHDAKGLQAFVTGSTPPAAADQGTGAPK